MKALLFAVVLTCASCATPQEKQLAERMQRIDAYCRGEGCKIMHTPDYEALQRALDELLNRVKELELARADWMRV